VAVSTHDRREPPAPPASSTLEEHPAGGWMVLSPMTGVVVDVYAKAGDKVVEGNVLMVIEAMKMNNELRAQRAGTVREVYVKEGQRVEPGTPLLVLE
jgi:biotin carboxyl carrier protein